MAKYCPQVDREVVYLACQDCDDRLCEKDVFVLLIAGTRTYSNYGVFRAVCDRVLSHQSQVMIVSGGARGADEMAERYAEEKGYPLKVFPAEWEKHGKRAGYIRNEAMHKYIARFRKRGVLLFWDGVSRGTGQSIDLAREYGNEIRVFDFVSGRFRHENKRE